MFGGFDGDFYNDLNVLPMDAYFNKTLKGEVEESSKDIDYFEMINN